MSTQGAQRLWDLEGWDAIAFVLGVKARTAMRWAQEPGEDPMPVFYFRGRVRAVESEIHAWMTRQITGAR